MTEQLGNLVKQSKSTLHSILEAKYLRIIKGDLPSQNSIPTLFTKEYNFREYSDSTPVGSTKFLIAWFRL